MISWARLALGQTQETAEPEAVESGDAIAPWPEDAGTAPPPTATPAPAGSAWVRWAARLFGFMALASAIVAVTFLFIRQGQYVQRLEHQLTLAQSQVSQLQERNLELTQQLAGFQAERSMLDERVFSLSVQLSSASAELQRASERLTATQELAREISQAQEQRDIELARVSSERDAARRETDELKQEQAGLTRSVTHLRQRLALLDRDYQELSAQFDAFKATQAGAQTGDAAAVADDAPSQSQDFTPSPEPAAVPAAVAAAVVAPAIVETRAVVRPASVELPPVRVESAARSPGPSTTSVGGLVHGRLVNVNERQRFVIIDQGSEDGVQEGMVFDIIQEGAPVGRAAAVRVRPKLAACNLLTVGRAGVLLAGDLVVQRDMNHQ